MILKLRSIRLYRGNGEFCSRILWEILSDSTSILYTPEYYLIFTKRIK